MGAGDDDARLRLASGMGTVGPFGEPDDRSALLFRVATFGAGWEVALG